MTAEIFYLSLTLFEGINTNHYRVKESLSLKTQLISHKNNFLLINHHSINDLLTLNVLAGLY